MAGAPVFAGYADPRERLAASLYSKKIVRRGIHVVEMGVALLSDATAVALAPANVELPREAEAATWAAGEASHRPLCALAPGAGWGAKRWPAAKFGQLAQELHARGFDVVVSAAREWEPLANLIVAASGGTARAIACDLAGLIALLRQSSLLVGGDSGPTHLAAALGVPLVALFGPTDPARNGPWGPGACGVLRDPSSVTSYKRVAGLDPGLEHLSVAEVLSAALELSSAIGATGNVTSSGPET
jgi:heptosyltransferase-1